MKKFNVNIILSYQGMIFKMYNYMPFNCIIIKPLGVVTRQRSGRHYTYQITQCGQTLISVYKFCYILFEINTLFLILPVMKTPFNASRREPLM